MAIHGDGTVAVPLERYCGSNWVRYRGGTVAVPWKRYLQYHGGGAVAVTRQYDEGGTVAVVWQYRGGTVVLW